MNRKRAAAVTLLAFGAVVACSADDGTKTESQPPTPVTPSSDAGADDPMNLAYNPTFEPDYNRLEPNPAANPVSPAQRDAVTVTPTSLELPAAEAAEAKTWEVGRVVVSAPGNGTGANPLGFARRVKAVREENGKVIVDTETVGLEDLATGEFQFRIDPNDPEARDVDLSKLDPKWAGKNLYQPFRRGFTPAQPLTDDFPGAIRIPKLPGQPGWWDDVIESATDLAGTIAQLATDAANTIGSGVDQILDAAGNIIPKSFSASVGIEDSLVGGGTFALFENLNYERVINPNGKLPMKFSIKGNGKLYSGMEFYPGFQVGARIPNYLHPDRESFQTWVNVDSQARANLDINLDIDAKLESAGGAAGSDLERRLNENADYAQNVLAQQRQALFGDPDLKPAGGWKKTLYMSKPKTRTFFAGIVPVVITATVQLDLECGFEAKGTVHAKVKVDQQTNFKFRASYDEAGGATADTPRFISMRTKDVNITGGGSVMIACGLIPRINTYLYDTVGLNVGVRASMVAQAAYASTCTSPTSVVPSGQMDLALKANIGIQIGARFQAPGSSSAGIQGQSAGFDIGPIEPWNMDIPIGAWTFPATGLGYCTPTCRDGKVSAAETDVDCGGGACSSCTTGQKCKVSSDCYSPGSCNAGICKVDPCADRVKNADETGVDCGGKTCAARCPQDSGCNATSDCASGLYCNLDTRRCQTSSCKDGIKNGGETAVDCGGPCPACPVGAPSLTGEGCASGQSNGRFCVASKCQNLQKDLDEGGIDCGGTSTCGKCPLGWNCTQRSDCQSIGTQVVICNDARRCEIYVPTPQSCTDGQKSPTETDVDCGGTCTTKCIDGKSCTVPTDCASSNCSGGVCAAAQPPGIVFVTSTKHIATFGGLAGADAICNNLATAASLAGTFKAFLADSVTGPAARMTRRAPGYRLKNGAVVALSPEEFFSGAHRLPIDMDETGAQLALSERIWTGTNGAGTTTGNWCNDWTAQSGNVPPLGLSDATDGSWASSSAPSFCDASLRLYCVQQ